MSKMKERLRLFEEAIRVWTPETGFKARNMMFSPADIIFGKRIAEAIIKHNCCDNAAMITEEIRNEANSNTEFEAWFCSKSTDFLQDLCEFLIYHLPKQKKAS